MDKSQHFIKLDNAVDTTSVYAMLGTFSAIFGFIYEIIFYYINGGMEQIYWRGSCFGPWITIYFIGGYVIYFSTAKLKKHPLLVLLVGGIGCGVLEILIGIYLDKIWGNRGWDYSTEIWNFGNIGGYICLRSIVFFALSSLLLMYVVVPVILLIQKKMGKYFRIPAFVLSGLFISDMIYNFAVVRAFPALVSANEFYESIGFSIMSY